MTTESMSQGTTKKLKFYKRGKWIRVTKGTYAGTKRWFSAETRNKMAQIAQRNFSTCHKRAEKPKAAHPARNPETGTVVRLSQETATLVNNFAGVGVTFEEAVEYLLKFALAGHLGKVKLGKVLSTYTPDPEE